MKLSAIIIAKDAEEHIADAINSVSFADETIVIDNGSIDRTLNVVSKMGAKSFSYRAKGFADARNFGLQKAKGEWVFYIDSDERVTDVLQKEIESAIKNKESDIVAFKVKRKNYYYGNHQWPYIEKLERLFRKKNLEEWYGDLHESPKIKGSVGLLDGFLLHYTRQNLESMVEKTIAWSKVEAELRFRANHPKMAWWRFFRVMLTAFYDSYIKQGGWKAGIMGLIESIYQSFSMFITYSRLWEFQNKQNGEEKN
ncbi:MAG: glycosyltransferase family 2 protein [Candidatus Levyibacteriota bacterium]|nr:MAG: glycosyltransferase family 2 protein [Candidatus Levybacteria bacterium]